MQGKNTIEVVIEEIWREASLLQQPCRVQYRTRIAYNGSEAHSTVSGTDELVEWLEGMQAAGTSVLFNGKGWIDAPRIKQMTIDGIVLSSGTARFLEAADRLHVTYSLSKSRKGINAATMAYALPKPQEDGSPRSALYFLVFSQPDGEHISKSTLRAVTGVTKADNARAKAKELLKEEMEVPAYTPFVSADFKTQLLVVFDENSLAKQAQNDFSTGIRPESGGGYIQMCIRDAYTVLRSLHAGNVSTVKLL